MEKKQDHAALAGPEHHRRANKVFQAREAPFAGRIGGNLEFTASSESLLQKQPDAAPIQHFADSLRFNGFLDASLWKMAIIECWATCLLVFSLGAGACGLTAVDQSKFAVTLYAGLINFIGLMLFIFAAGPASGGHLNPSITMGTFFAGLSTFPRTVLYISAQATGGIIGGYLLRLALGADGYFPAGIIPGCTVDTTMVSPGQFFVLEMMFAQALLFAAFGVGLDPRQKKVFGPAFGPVLVGLTLGFGTLVSALVKPGYSGVGFNSARCLGLMVAKGNDMHYHYIHWLATLTAAMINGIFYYYIPPYDKEKRRAEACVEEHANKASWRRSHRKEAAATRSHEV